MQKMPCLCGILCIFQAFLVDAAISQRCQSTEQNPHGCCDGYTWNSVVDDCVECRPGFSGPGCFVSCPYPLYGKDCQNICTCSPTEYCDFMFGCLESQGAISTEPIVAIIDFDNIVYSTHQMEEKSTLTIPKITESNIRGNFENRIQNIWQFMLIMLAVFSVMTLTYLGKCVHRQWTSRSLQVSKIRTLSPNIVLNGSNQTDCKYEETQNVEYEEPELYLSAAPNDSSASGINNQRKMEFGSIRPSPQLLFGALNEEQKCEKKMYENQLNKGERETEDLYLSPVNIIKVFRFQWKTLY